MRGRILLVFAAACFLVTASCENRNFFGKFHKAGTSSNVTVLLNDANSALADGDSAQAKQIADKILQNDPDNSEALYVSAAAGLKEAGLDLADIVTNVIVSSDVVGTDLIPDGIDLATLSEATQNAVDNLKKIADGQADGAIPTDDVDVNLNLGIVQVLNSATKIFDLDGDGVFGEDDPDEPLSLTSDFNISTDTAKLNALKGNTTALTVIKDVAVSLIGGTATEALLGGATNAALTDAQKNATGSIDYLDVAVSGADLDTGDTTISDLKSNIDELTGSGSSEGNSVLDVWNIINSTSS